MKKLSETKIILLLALITVLGVVGLLFFASLFLLPKTSSTALAGIDKEAGPSLLNQAPVIPQIIEKENESGNSQASNAVESESGDGTQKAGVDAVSADLPLPDLFPILRQISEKENELGNSLANSGAKLEKGEDFVSFISAIGATGEESETSAPVSLLPASEIPVPEISTSEITTPEIPVPEVPALETAAPEIPAIEFATSEVPAPETPFPGIPAIDYTSPQVRTLFNTKADTVEKRTLIKQGNEVFSFTATLDNQGVPYQQTTTSGLDGARQVYFRQNEVFVYSQNKTPDNNVQLKEWIYASRPNLAQTGSQYVWNFQADDDNSYSLVLKQKDDGTIELYRQMQINGLADNAPQKRKSVMEVVRQAFKSKVNINDEQLVASFEPLIYWTKDNIKKTGKFTLLDDRTLVMTIDEPVSAYPLLIDPSLNYGQWLGGVTGAAYIDALAIDPLTDEIYVGGFAAGSGIDEIITWQGTHSGGNEGFVVEIADGTIPTLNWGQWLGGTGSDYVRALAVNGDEIYAGGNSASATGWETVTFQGAYSGSSDEGFVVEIADGVTPTLNWGQWLGGTGSVNVVYALAVNGEEIYAGGATNGDTSWETPFQGYYDYTGGTEGFVIEISDVNTTPTLNWGQWLGGTGTDYVYALAVNGEEIYAGGSSNSTDSWETVTFQGALSGNEGFVIEIADGVTPTLNWGQWLGGTGTDYVYALAVNGEEIYAGGSATNATTWETVTFQGALSGTEGYVVEIADGTTPTLNWGQWLGGTGTDQVLALAVNGEEIYAGGSATNATTWETVTFQGALSGTEGFVIEISDVNTTPTLNWGQWLGGTGTDQVKALAVNGDEIYAGGRSAAATTWETVTFQGVFATGGTEGFVIEIADGTTPTLNWGQWLGGGVGSNDYIRALAVNGDEIYAGGDSASATGWETVTFQGAYSGSSEGFVIEIADDAIPTLNWGQWLGGTGADRVTSLAVNGDEIYAGGYTAAATSWETVTFQGALSGVEGFVVEIADGTTPTLNWGQWLGGTGTDYVYALAVNGEEIYAGGSSNSTDSWETVTFQGAYSANDEGFVIEISDVNATPTLNWGQWLGGGGSDYVNALAVDNDEIYAGGYTAAATSWETVTFQGAYSGGWEGFVIEIADGVTPTLNWGQWLGGTGTDQVNALAVDGEEIYAGGYSGSIDSWETVTFQGALSGVEGFVVEIADGTTPTLNWGQWLGGTGSDYVNALAVDNDEIYAGGYSDSATGWETVTFQGDYSGADEGFVIEIADGVTPTLNWGQWLGGTGTDRIFALAVNGDEIYAGGDSASATGWETVTFQGAYSGGWEGFVVEIADDAPVFDQKHFKIYQDDAALNAATQYAAEDANYNVAVSTNFRIRFETANTGALAGNITRRLEFNEDAGAWTQVTTGTNNVRLQDSTNFADAEATTALLTATGDFIAGQGKDTGSDALQISLTNAYYTEDEYSLKFQAGAVGHTYQFRITNAGVALDIYTQTPSITPTGGNSAPTIISVSDYPDPLVAGNTVNFSVNWNDADAEGIKMLICKTSSFTPGASPTCDGGQWCSNDNDYDLANPVSCAYATQQADIGAQSYYAFVCDNEPTCSSASSGAFIVGATSTPSIIINGSLWLKGLFWLK